MERVWGPVNGFYIAAYASPAGDGERWCSYCKVSADRVVSYWEVDNVVFKLFGGEYHSGAEAALVAAHVAARNAIGRMPQGALTLLELGLYRASRQLLCSVGTSIRHRMA